MSPKTKEKYKPYLEEVTLEAECVIQRPEFLEYVATMKFSSTHMTGQEVANTLRKLKNAEVTTEKGIIFGKTIARVYSDRPNLIYFVESSLDKRTKEDTIATAIHEWLHVFGFKHSSSKDLNSVPYSLGYKSKEFIKYCRR